jgi:hypothetical protein
MQDTSEVNTTGPTEDLHIPLHRCPKLRSLPRVVNSVSTGSPFTAARPCGNNDSRWTNSTMGHRCSRAGDMRCHRCSKFWSVPGGRGWRCISAPSVPLQKRLHSKSYPRIRFVNWSFILGWLVHLGKWSNEICSFPVIEEIKFWFRWQIPKHENGTALFVHQVKNKVWLQTFVHCFVYWHREIARCKILWCFRIPIVKN